MKTRNSFVIAIALFLATICIPIQVMAEETYETEIYSATEDIKKIIETEMNVEMEDTIEVNETESSWELEETVETETTYDVATGQEERCIVDYELLYSNDYWPFYLYQKYFAGEWVQEVFDGLQFVAYYNDGTEQYFGMEGIEGIGKPDVDLSNVNWYKEGEYPVYITFLNKTITKKAIIEGCYEEIDTNSDITMRVAWDLVDNYKGLSLKVEMVEDENEKQFVRDCSMSIKGNPNAKVFIYDFIFVDSKGNEIETPTPGYSPDLVVTLPIPEGIDYSQMELYEVKYKEGLFGEMFQVIDINEEEIIFVITEMGHYAIGGEAQKGVNGSWGNNITWKYVNETLTISGQGDMPETIPINPPWNVSYVRNNVKKIVIESGVTSICDQAFWNYQKVEEVVLADTVNTIGSLAFGTCINLKTIRLPENLTYIGDGAFDYCYNLENITLPKNFKDFGSNVFSLCHALKNIYVDSDSKLYSSIDGVLYNYDKTKVVMYPYGRTDNTYVIPVNVTTIGESAFANSSSLVEVIVPSSLKVIENSAFYKCSNLENFDFPEGVLEIGAAAFQNCSSLSHIYLPSSIQKIGANAFNKCNNLEMVWMPDTIQIMNDSLFSGCGNLLKCDIPKNVTRIEGGLFAGCSKIQEITVPSGVTYLGPWSFVDCDSLKTIYFEGPAPKVKAMDAAEIPYEIMPNSSSVTAYVYADFWNSYASLRSEYNRVNWVKRGYKTIKDLDIVREPYVTNYLVGTDLENITFDGLEFEVTFADGSVELCGLDVPLKDGRKITWQFKPIDYAGSTSFVAQIGALSDSFDIVFVEKPYIEEGVENTTLVVETTVSNQESNYIRVETNNENADVIVYDMHLEDSNGNVYELENEQVTVVMPIPEGWDASRLKVYYVDSQENVMTDLNAVVSDDGKSLSFVATHFSYYAFVFDEVVENYQIKYDCNGSSSVIDSQSKVQGKALKLAAVYPKKSYTLSFDANGGSVTNHSKKLNCIFDNWNTSLNGNGVSYAPGMYYKNDSDVTLYAQWIHPKAGNLDIPVRDGYTFEGWFTDKTSGTKVTETTIMTNNQKLYAHWTDKPLYTDDVEIFVARLYNVCLNRNPDESGLETWTTVLKNKTYTGVSTAYGFIFSTEFKNKNLCNEDYVEQLYQAFMGRASDAGGKETWVKLLNSGTTREEVFNGFALSNEFKALCNQYGIEQGKKINVPANGTMPNGKCSICGKEDGVTSFVKRLYKVCLNRDADAGGLETWTKSLRNHTETGRSVAYGFIFSNEFKNKNYSNEAYVEYLYEAFMGRSSDANGKKMRVDLLNSGKYTRVKVFDGFVGSAEFTVICNSYGITRD